MRLLGEYLRQPTLISALQQRLIISVRVTVYSYFREGQGSGDTL